MILPIEAARTAPRRTRTRAMEPATPVVVVASGREAAGTSTLAALLALAASGTHERVLLVDADFRVPALRALLKRATVAAGVGAATEEELETGPVEVSGSLALLAALPREEEGEAPEAAAGRLSGLFGGYSLVVIDAGSRLESLHTACAAGVTRAVVVGQPDRISIAANYALVKVLATRLGVEEIGLLVNHADESTAEQVHAEIHGAARYFLRAEVAFCGSVPDDPCLRAGLEAGMSLPEAVADSPAAAAVRRISTTLVPQPTPAAAARAERRSHWRS